MPPKKRGKKKNGTAAERKLRLKLLIEEFDEKLESTIEEMQQELETTCAKIEEHYDFALANIPEKFHNLTLEAYNELISKTPPSSKTKIFAISSIETKLKCMTERKALKASLSAKKTQANPKQSFLGYNSQKRNTGILSTISKSSAARPQRIRRPLASVQQVNTPLNHRKATLMATPVSKNLPAGSKAVVTPKFDTRLPLPNGLLRKPRANEVIMSMSGSPLQNPIMPSDKPAVLFSVGGKVVNLAETTQLNSIDFDCQAKETLKLVQERLARMINN